MKAASLLIVPFLWTAAGAPAQERTPFTVVERGPHHRVWQREGVRVLPNGRAITNRSSVVELETGMHRLQDGQWVESKEEIELFQNGAIARHGPIQIIFEPNINTRGAIDLLTADNQRLRSHVIGLGLFDPSTGNSELIAEVKDSIGELQPPNEIFYRDAFNGVAADLRYTSRKSGFEQDVIIRETVELPPGYDPATTVMEVWTEFIEAPVPQKIINVRGRAQDETLDFGTMRMGLGKAFVLGEDRTGANTVPITKKWMTLEGRTFLIEAVEFQAVSERLQDLPARKERAALPGRKTIQPARADANRRPFPAARRAAAARSNQKIMLASLPLSNRGLVLDYEAVSSTSNFRFQCDRTYYVSGSFTISGTATFEGGTVIKYANTNSAGITLSGTVVWDAGPYRPVILTARDDHSVGEQIGSAVRSGYYATKALNITASTFDIQNLRVSYASSAVYADSTDGTIRHAQFIQCGVAVDSNDPDLSVGNALIYDCGRAFRGDHINIVAEQITAHKITNFWSHGTSSSLSLTNSLLISVTNGSSYSGANNYTNLDEAGIFQTVGAAAHYLNTNSSHRNLGTTNIGTKLLGEIRKRTTYPPTVIGNGGYYTNSLTLYPNAQRDADEPDLGYHYDSLDYVFSGVILTNASITAMPGVAIGARTFNAISLGLLGGSAFYCEGTPDNLNRFVRYNTVQEQANTNWMEYASGTAYHIATAWSATATAPILRLRFTEFSTPASGAEDIYQIYGFDEDAGSHSIRDCQFHGGDLWALRPTLNVTNSLFNRIRTIIAQGSSSISPTFRNCTFVGGDLQLYNDNTGTWTLKDNLFDGTTSYFEGTLSHSHNAYTTNATRLTPTNVNDVKLSVTNVTYQTGWLGKFYIPTNLTSHSPLFNAGSQNATNAGLYHYTMVTNQTRELSTTVDLGFHFIAVGSDGLPLDTDADGSPNYLEDANGNGSADSGETDWQSYNSLNGLGSAPAIQVFTPLK